MGQRSKLANKNNPMQKIINNGVGEWMQNIDEADFIEHLFLQEATGDYLDLQGRNYGVKRKIDETDEDYRNRIIYESLGHLTVDYLKEIYGLNVYVKVNNFDKENNDLTSDNPYLTDKGFMVDADEQTRRILNKKFVLDNNISWLE